MIEGMTLRQLMDTASAHPGILVAVFVLPPLIVVAVGWLRRDDEDGPGRWRYLYAVLVYLVCVPGIFAAVVTAYAMFFSGEDLLDVLVTFLPILSMVATVILVGRTVAFDEIPGFGRLTGLMTLIGVLFILALGLEKMRLWVLFHAPLWILADLVLLLCVVAGLGSKVAFGSKR